MGAGVGDLLSMAFGSLPWTWIAVVALVAVVAVLGLVFALAQRQRAGARTGAAFAEVGDPEAPASLHEAEELDRALRKSLEDAAPPERWESLPADLPRQHDPAFPAHEETKGGEAFDDDLAYEVHSPLVAPSELELALRR